MMHDGTPTYQPDLTPQWTDILVRDAWGALIDRSDPDRAYFSQVTDGVEFDVTEPVGNREMAAYGGFTEPSDPVFDAIGVGAPWGSDNYGDIFCIKNNFWRKRPSDATFINKSGSGFSQWGFPVYPPPPGDSLIYSGAHLAFNPNDSNFDGYVLYDLTDTQVIYYKSSPSYPVAVPIVGHIPGIARYGPSPFCNINGIVTDPGNTNNVWVCLGAGGIYGQNFADGTRNRVIYSPDHGTTWIDVSVGLPQRISVDAITYDEVSKTLYCGTDAGMYSYSFNDFVLADTFTIDDGIKNASVIWSCFSQGKVSGHNFPNVTVTDMGINHCAGKLYAATFGRSVWSTDIYPTNIIPNVIDTITTTTTWDSSNQYITGSIYIQSGGTLNISGNDTVHMPKNGAILVAPGGRLNVNRSMITNDCSQCFWQGISALNNYGQPQSPANCGWVSITNGSTIQHAIIGVANYDATAADSVITYGGVIQSSGSSYINNQNAVSIKDFSNYNASYTPIPDLSWFSNCTFLLDNNYKGDALHIPMTYMVNLIQCDGVALSGCQFLNRDSSIFSHRMGEGIHAANASFNVGAYYTTVSFAGQRSRFCGFVNGIEISGIASADLTTSIDQADFDTVSTGIYISACNSVSTTRCNFTVGNGIGQVILSGYVSPIHTFLGCKQNIGIYNQNSSLFRIESNVFKGSSVAPPSEWYNMGAVLANDWLGITSLPASVPALSNTVYSNTFESLSQGVSAIGCNGALIPLHSPLGTQISCNTFITNGTDILIANDGNSYYQDIDPYQGSLSLPAGNTFSGSSNNIIDGGSGITYYYNPAVSNSHPTVVTTTEVTLVTTSATNTCPSTFSGSSSGSPVLLTAAAISGLSTNFSAYRMAVNDSTNIYDSLIDGGSTDSLLNIVYAISDTPTLYKILVAASPWLSVTALEDVGDLQMLPYTNMLTLLEQNPDPLRSPDFINYMLNDYNFSPDDLDSLASASDSTTRRTTLESSIHTNTILMGNMANIITMAIKAPVDTAIDPADTTMAGICTDSTSIYYTLDSNTTYFGIDSVDSWLQNIGGDWSWYARIGFYNGRQQFTTADSLYNLLSSVLSPKYYPDQYNSFSDLWGIISKQQGSVIAGGFFRPDQLWVDPSLVPAAATSSTGPLTDNTAMQMINNIGIINVHTIPIVQVCFYPYLSGLRKSHKTPIQPPGYGITNINGKSTARLSVAPNPASNTVTFSWSESNPLGNINITVTNALGEMVTTLSSETSNGNITWNTSRQPAGVYIYQASDQNGVIAQGKLVIIR